MNLNSVIVFSQEKFNAAGYDEIRRGDILMHFFRDEIGMTADNFEDLLRAGKTEVAASELEGSDRARFFLWYFVNYVIDDVVEDE